jgi:type VI secretion system secreted protein VgrG
MASSEILVVSATVKIDSFPIIVSNLTLSQEFYQHHTFEIEISDDLFAMVQTQIAVPHQAIAPNLSMLGSLVEISLQYNNTSYTFNGIVTDVAYNCTGRAKTVSIIGKSRTILWNGVKRMDSFVNCSIGEIVDSLKNTEKGCDRTGKGLTIVCNSGGQKKTIPYICRYNETAFDFLNRLVTKSSFYDGTQLSVVGDGENPSYQDDPTILTCPGNLNAYELTTAATPFQVGSYDYDSDTDAESVISRPAYFDSLDFLKNITLINQSTKMYPRLGMLPKKKEEQDAADVFFGTAGKLRRLKGKTTARLLKLNEKITVNTSSSEVFNIVKINYTFGDGAYLCEFEAVAVSYSMYRPFDVDVPTALPSLAVVKASSSEEGRVKVQFPWQAALGKTTPWLRLLRPYGGAKADEKKVKNYHGVLFTPEVNDQVMVGFEHGDPSRPFVMGSLLRKTANQSHIADDKNYIKEIKTTQGLAIKLDDNKKNISISSAENSLVELNQEKIEISSTNKSENIQVETIKLVMKSDGIMTINSDSNIDLEIPTGIYTEELANKNLMVKKKNVVTIQENENRTINDSAVILIDGNMTETIEGNLNSRVLKERKEASVSEMVIVAKQEDIEINAQTNVKMNAASKTTMK